MVCVSDYIFGVKFRGIFFFRCLIVIFNLIFIKKVFFVLVRGVFLVGVKLGIIVEYLGKMYF